MEQFSRTELLIGKDGIEKLLGPTFEYFGIGLKNTIESFNNKAKENLNNIIQKSIVKKGKKLEENGIINPRILKEVVLDGAFCDTNVVQEYYSGILACSRTESGSDEGIYYIDILKGLSSRQLKLHYLIYSKFINQNKSEDTFQTKLFKYIDAKDLKDSDVYNKVNIDRRLFSKIRSNENYNPSKKTAIALSIALELSYNQTQDLLGRAGYTLSKSNKFDLIIEACIKKGIYNIFEINNILYSFDLPLLD